MRKLAIFLLIVCVLVKCNTKPKEQGGNNEPVKTAEQWKSAIHYTEHGNGDTALVFVHGWGINSSYWNNQVNYFKNRFKVVTVDLAGHGVSPAYTKEASLEQLATGVDSVIGYLKLKHIILIGHSMSGDVNLHVMNRFPENVIGFIGIDNLQEAGRTPSAEDEKMFAQFYHAAKKDYTGTIRQFSGGSLFHPKTDSAIIKRVMDDVLRLDSTYSLSLFRSMSEQYKAEQQIIPKMKIPLVLVICQDSLEKRKYLDSLCNGNYAYWTIKESGHYPMIEKPEEFNIQLEKAINYAISRKE